MTKLNSLRSKYEKLRNTERFQLMAGAISRGDKDEVTALLASATRQTYAMSDAWLVDRYEALWKTSTLFWLATETLLRERETLTKGFLAVMLKQKDGSDVETLGQKLNQDPRTKVLCREAMENSQHLQATASAIKRLADDVGLTSETVIAYAPVDIKARLEPSSHKWSRPRAVAIPSEIIDHYYSLFASVWPGLRELAQEKGT